MTCFLDIWSVDGNDGDEVLFETDVPAGPDVAGAIRVGASSGARGGRYGGARSRGDRRLAWPSPIIEDDRYLVVHRNTVLHSGRGRGL